jgi:hypothetical protein
VSNTIVTVGLGELKGRLKVVLKVAAIRALYIGFAVNRRNVGDAASSHARRLILSWGAFFAKEKVVATAVGRLCYLRTNLYVPDSASMFENSVSWIS